MTKKVLITGSREWDNWDIMSHAISAEFEGTQPMILIEGDARGADKMAGEMARRSPYITLVMVPADWDNLESWEAGPRRNTHMLDLLPDVVLSFRVRGAGNRGTQNCMRQAAERGIPVKEYWNDDTIVVETELQNDSEGTTVS